MPWYLLAVGLFLAGGLATFFATLSYGLRDFSRARLAERLDTYGQGAALPFLLDHARDLIFVTAVARMAANIAICICCLRFAAYTRYSLALQYAIAGVASGFVTLMASVAVPHAAAKYAGESAIAFCVPVLRGLRVALTPVTKISHATDALFRRASGGDEPADPRQLNDQVGEEILSVVDQAQKEGTVDPHERAMIESVIAFRDTTAGQIMTARPEMVTIELPATLADVRRVAESSGNSRIPVFQKSLDGGLVGILYVRDLLRYVGEPPDAAFDIRKSVRPAFFVPETTPLRDLLQDFRVRKVHLAIVLDEYGGTAGLVTIEDILEELVGDIRDEHEPAEPALIQRVDDHTYEADARAYLDDLNALTGLKLPDDAGYDTLGGFVTTSLSRIPPAGTTFEQSGVRYVILAAEPQRVTRVRIELPAEPSATADDGSPHPDAPPAD